MRRELSEWAQQAHDLRRRVAELIPVVRATSRDEHHRDPQEALRVRLRELAGSLGSIWIPQTDGHAETGRMKRERQAHLPPLRRGKAERSHKLRFAMKFSDLSTGTKRMIASASRSYSPLSAVHCSIVFHHMNLCHSVKTTLALSLLCHQNGPNVNSRTAATDQRYRGSMR